MNRLISLLIFSFLISAGNKATSKTKSTLPVHRIEISNDFSCEDTLSKTYFSSNDIRKNMNGELIDDLHSKIKSSELKVVPSHGSYLVSCDNEDYSVKISGANLGNGWDISSVSICGVEVCQILLQSSNVVLVYPNSGTPGTGDIVINSKSKGKTIIKNGFTYQVEAPTDQSKNLNYSNVETTSCDISWTRGNGEACVVFLKEINAGSFIPKDQTTYTAVANLQSSKEIGDSGWYCVYNGMGSSVSLSGLKSGATYTTQVFEFNGPVGFESYQRASTTDNPKIQEMKRPEISNDPVPMKNTATLTFRSLENK
ncbi:MAG: IPT/TIG domain-containing protein [Prolixibacteraceae bacterium]|jgi:hypothetical protein